MMLDASVVRNFGVLGRGTLLSRLVPAPTLVDVVLSADGDGELPGILRAIERDIMSATPGSTDHSLWTAAALGVEEALTIMQSTALLTTPTATEMALAIRLQSTAVADRAWRSELGVRARRLHAGEAACIAVATSRAQRFATDDADAAAAYTALSGRNPESTRSLLHTAVATALIEEADAMWLWQQLNQRLRGRLHEPWR